MTSRSVISCPTKPTKMVARKKSPKCHNCHNITSKMTEKRIFELFLPKHYDYPKLESESAEIIAKGFTDIIYDTLKLKSSLPASKRLNLLVCI